MYGFCVSMRPLEKALLLLLLSQMNQTPDIWCISNKVICSRSPSWGTLLPQSRVRLPQGPLAVSVLLGNASCAPFLEADA